MAGPYRAPQGRGDEPAGPEEAADLGAKRATFLRGGVLAGWPEVDLHERGLVLRHSYFERTEVPFDEVDAITYDYEGLLSGPPRVTLVCFDGTRSELPKDLHDLERVLGELDREVTMPITAQAKEALASGQRMVFGPLAIELDGIVLHGQSLAWDHLSRVDAERDALVFYAREPLGRFGWAPVRELPHPTALVEVLRMRTTVVARGLPLLG